MLDPRFRESVILLTQRNEYGAAGVIVNRPTGRTLSSAFSNDPAFENRSEPLYFGGPVLFQSIFFLLRSPERPGDSIHVFEDIYLGTDLELLHEKLKKDDFADHVRVFAGYAGWSPGQLESEIARGDWHPVKADEKTLFGDEPETLWRKLIESFTGHWVRRSVENPRT
jgi:putative transcriptional regulator